MIPIKSDMTEEEEKAFRRFDYETQKEGFIEFHKQMGYPKETLDQFLVNSLKKEFKEQLKEDGLI